MTTIIDSAAAMKAGGSPEALLRAAVSGAKATPDAPSSGEAPAKAAPVSSEKTRRPDPLTMGVAGAALALGTLLGAGTAILAAPKADAGVALADIAAGLEGGRTESSRLAGEVERLGKTVAALREAGEAARGEARTRGSAITERLAKMEQAVTAKVAALGERSDQADREQIARIATLAAQIEKKPVAAGSVPPPGPAPKAEPVQTGSLPETKTKPAVIETWAVRDVYDGTAMIEDRHRRLVEVAAGDSVPGLGRVDAVERRGRAWVVVTRQGIVAPQPW